MRDMNWRYPFGVGLLVFMGCLAVPADLVGIPRTALVACIAFVASMVVRKLLRA